MTGNKLPRWFSYQVWFLTTSIRCVGAERHLKQAGQIPQGPGLQQINSPDLPTGLPVVKLAAIGLRVCVGGNEYA